MRLMTLIGTISLLAACQPPGPAGDYDGFDFRQQPSITEPGVHVSGSAEFGVVYRKK